MQDTLLELNKNKQVKYIIGMLSNTYFDLSEIFNNSEESYKKIKDIISTTDYILLPAYPLNKSTSNQYKFFIIRNVDLFATEKISKKLRLFSNENMIGSIVGKNGSNINLINDHINSIFKYVNYYFPTIEDIGTRPINNDYGLMINKLKELIGE